MQPSIDVREKNKKPNFITGGPKNVPKKGHACPSKEGDNCPGNTAPRECASPGRVHVSPAGPPGTPFLRGWAPWGNPEVTVWGNIR